MSNETKIIKANGKIPNKNNTKCNCNVEKFENIGSKKSFYDSYSSIIFYVLKFSLITLFLYLIIYNLRKQ